MADLPRLRRGAVLRFPRAHRARACRIADVLIDKADAYMIGNIVVSIVAGLAAFAARSPGSACRSQYRWRS